MHCHLLLRALARITVLGIALTSVCHKANAQAPTTRPVEGLSEATPTAYVLTGAELVVDAQTRIQGGVLVVRDGAIAHAGPLAELPADARVVDFSGKTIWPGLIDAYSEVEVSAPEGGAPHWNSGITPQRSAAVAFTSNGDLAETLRSQGIVARLIAPRGGQIKGTSAVVTTGEGNGDRAILRHPVALHVSLTTARSRRQYPGSPMGAVALVRQTLLDASWYRDVWQAYRGDTRLPRPEQNDALQSIMELVDADVPLIIDAADERSFLRADRLAREFGLRAIIRGSGREYRRLDAVAATRRPILLPVNFPRAPDVSTPEAARLVTLARLMHWDHAPENPGRLATAGVQLAITTDRMADKSKWLAAVRQAVARGLEPDDALRAVTQTPAELLGVADQLGTLETGKQASFLVTDGPLFEEDTKILETWVAGKRYEHARPPEVDLRGKWQWSFTDSSEKEWTIDVILRGEPDKLQGRVQHEDQRAKLQSVSLRDGRLALTFPGRVVGAEGPLRGTWIVMPNSLEQPGLLTKLAWPDGTIVDGQSRRVAPHNPQVEQPPGTTDETDPSDAEVDDPQTTESPDEDPAESDKLESQEVPPPEERVSGEARRQQQKPEENRPGEDQPQPDPDQPPTEVEESPEPDSDQPPTEVEESPEPDTSEPEQPEPEQTEAEKPEKPETEQASHTVVYPLGAYGRQAAPDQPQWVAFQHATVWTCEEGIGRLEDATVLVHQGRIAAVGTDVEVPEDALRIDATGKHITPGLIDCHSHIATDGGVNEPTQAITAEVRIGDFMDPDDIAIYRQLAGGVTTSNILHGSANPIGGQNQVIKLRWGALPEDIKFQDAPRGIKFALGENVKQSNWGNEYTSRYPQTRMGVVEIIHDAFQRAREYTERWEQWRRDRQGLPPRTDLELEALAEVLRGERWVHCHSYRQSEILALMKTCDTFGVQIGSLQHILEGYKLAEEMAQRQITGSTFSDWWAYKYEVFDAIPYNGALMHQAGVIVSYNSDDAELGRRLNLEAAKAVKYGGVAPEEALKFVTLNPARQLRIEDRVGSLQVGKDADLVVWSTSPLSIYARCEQTWIEGRPYFDVEEDRQMQARDAERHATLVRKILDSKAEMLKPGEEDDSELVAWPRVDLFCHHHGHDDGGDEDHTHGDEEQ